MVRIVAGPSSTVVKTAPYANARPSCGGADQSQMRQPLMAGKDWTLDWTPPRWAVNAHQQRLAKEAMEREEIRKNWQRNVQFAKQAAKRRAEALRRQEETEARKREIFCQSQALECAEKERAMDARTADGLPQALTKWRRLRNLREGIDLEREVIDLELAKIGLAQAKRGEIRAPLEQARADHAYALAESERLQRVYGEILGKYPGIPVDDWWND